ncbi:DNA-packaging protein [Lysinibacillus sp. KU-BSD001]|uniref:phage head-tail connector protein n=1 Tax=Lysinibacillus sp. KU-BSD001 TaxID=3141328 RepID=UPI0036E03B59
MLARIRRALRITSIAFDNEIQDLIDAAIADLGDGGISNLSETDPLIIQAVILYARSNFGLENAESEKFAVRYNHLKTQLALSGEYTRHV